MDVHAAAVGVATLLDVHAAPVLEVMIGAVEAAV
jgi:hypothetical protein